MFWGILFILVLILANGMFAAAEISLIAAARVGWNNGPKKATAMPGRALELAKNPDRFLPTVQIGITLVSAFGAAYGGQQIVARTGRSPCRRSLAVRCTPCRQSLPWQSSWRASRTLRSFWANWCPSASHCIGQKESRFWSLPFVQFIAAVGRPARVADGAIRRAASCGSCDCSPWANRLFRSTISST